MSEPSPILAREATFVIELLTPIHIGSGETDGGSDAGVVLDYNGLPGLPGTSIQGMLRAAVEESCGQPVAARIFGHSSRANEGTGRGGRLSVSWGVIHDQSNRPVKGYVVPADRDRDPVLRDASRPMLRDHVCINGRGVAKRRGKFDERVVSAGHRFTVRLRFVTAHGDSDADWHVLGKILNWEHLRLGGKTRRGLGAFRVDGWTETTDRIQAGFTQPADADVPLQFPTVETWRITLTPTTFWMFGGGNSQEVDSAPVTGTRIAWDLPEGRGRVERVALLPGSGIKGPLWHRTLFHANRIVGNWADLTDDERKEAQGRADGLMGELFGFVRPDGAAIGRVFIDDDGIPHEKLRTAPAQNHVAINPFTGGAKDSALFNDQPLEPGAGMELVVKLQSPSSRGSKVSDAAKMALESALHDLAVGRLALGAHEGRGYGRFRGSVRGPEASPASQDVSPSAAA